MPIRVRLALAFGAAAAVLVALGGWMFVSLLSSSMLRSIDAQLTTAAGVAGRYVSTGSGQRSQSAQLPGEYLVQVVDGSGRVTASGPDAGRTPLVSATALQHAADGPVAETRVIDGEPTRVVAEPYAGHPGYVAVAAYSLESYDKSVSTITAGVAVGGALVIAVAVVGSYVLARRALAPVERMRSQVQAMSATDDERGIPVPGTNDELSHLARTMNDLLARLHSSLARQRAFAADASHELRSPLAVLQGELELAGKSGRSKEDLQAAVSSAAEEVTRLTQLVEELLLLARSDSASLAGPTEPIDVVALLRHVCRVHERRAGAAGVRLVVSAPGELTAVADGHRLRQALDNLVDNALRFAPRDSQIELRASAQGNLLTLEVLDQGPGFDEEFLPHAFERFTRPTGDRSRADGGTGLGLAIVDAIAAAHGGRAAARNLPGGGAAVRLEFPASSPPSAPSAPSALPPPPWSPSSSPATSTLVHGPVRRPRRVTRRL